MRCIQRPDLGPGGGRVLILIPVLSTTDPLDGRGFVAILP